MGKAHNYILAGTAAVVCLVVYMITMYPTVTFMDSGELSGALYTFGVPHPTGYPLYLILGYVVSNLPLGGMSPVYKLNLLSAIFSALAVFVLFFVIKNSLWILYSAREIKKGNVKPQKDNKTANPIPKLGETELSLVSLFASIAAGISATFWANALSVEVYPLQGLIIALVLLICIKIYASISAPEKKNFIYLFLLVGLGFANHLTTVLLVPAILYVLYLQVKKAQLSRKMILASLVYIVPGLLLYGILIIRASSVPFFNWSNPNSISNLIYHVTGRDYSQLMFSGGSAFSNNAKIFGSGFFTEFGIIASVLGLYGVIIFYKKQRQLFAILLIVMLSCLLYAFNYSVRDIQVYFIQFYIAYSVFIAAGLAGTSQFLISGLKLGAKPAAAVIVAGVIITAFGFYYNYERNNNTSDYVVEDMTLGTFSSIEPNAVYITYDWGYTYPAALYYQQAEHKRQDIKAFNVKFLSAPWYLEGIKKYYPDVYKNCSAEIDDYIKADNAGDENLRVMKLNNLVKTFFARNFQSMPVYVSIDILLNKDMKTMISGFTFIPFGLAYKMVNKQNGYYQNAGVESLNAVFRPYKSGNTEKTKVNNITAGMYYETANYHYTNKNNALALRFLDKSISINSAMPDALNLKNKILSDQK